MPKKNEETQEGTRCEFVFDDYTMNCIEAIQKNLKIGTRKDAVKIMLKKIVCNRGGTHMMTEITHPVTGEKFTVDLGVRITQILQKTSDGTLKEVVELVEIKQLAAFIAPIFMVLLTEGIVQ